MIISAISIRGDIGMDNQVRVCPCCGGESADGTFCHSCRAAAVPPPAAQSSVGRWVIVGLCLFVAVILVIANLPRAPAITLYNPVESPFVGKWTPLNGGGSMLFESDGTGYMVSAYGTTKNFRWEWRSQRIKLTNDKSDQAIFCEIDHDGYLHEYMSMNSAETIMVFQKSSPSP